MSDLIAEIMKLIDAKSDLRIDDAVATAANTVTVGSSTVPVVLPALVPVTTGDFCQVLTQGPNRIILGPVGGSPNTYTPTLTGLAIGTGGFAENTAKWSFNGRTIRIEGVLVFGTAGTTFPTGGATVTLPTGYELTRTVNAQVGVCRTDTGGQTSYGPVVRSAATTAVLQAHVISGADAWAATYNTTVPAIAAWAAGNTITWQIDALAVKV